MELDLTKPNLARMFDYWLGGTHNFEIDRLLADDVYARFPEIVKEVKEGREGLQRVLTYLVRDQGIDAILDFGAGLPTCNNTHQVVLDLNPQARVIYSDIDPVTVAHAQEFIADLPNVIYLQCDAAHPEVVLEAPEVQECLNGQRRVGIIFMALAHLMTPETFGQACRTLYDWAAPDSYLYLAWAGGEQWHSHPRLLELRRAYQRFGHTAYFHTKEQVISLIAPWQVTEHGVFLDARWGLPAPESEVGGLHTGYCLLAHKPG
jgi:hypothetical protein